MISRALSNWVSSGMVSDSLCLIDIFIRKLVRFNIKYAGANIHFGKVISIGGSKKSIIQHCVVSSSLDNSLEISSLQNG